MNLAGIPPLSGFLGKIGLLQAGVAVGTPLAYTLVVGSVVTSILTLYAIVKAWNKAFWQTPPEAIPETRLPLSLVAPTTALVALGLLITVVAGPLYSYTDRAAHTLLDNGTYIDAVLGPDGRGVGQSSDEVDDAQTGTTDGGGS